MNDPQIVEHLCTVAGGVKELAYEIGVTRQTLWTWRAEKEISHYGRFLLQRYARQKRISLPTDFMERGE